MIEQIERNRLAFTIAKRNRATVRESRNAATDVKNKCDAIGFGEHTRRVCQPAPSPVGLAFTYRVFGEGAEHGTRRRVRSPGSLRLQVSQVSGNANAAFLMNLPIQLIATDFDGTIFAEFDNPPVPPTLQRAIASLQAQGAKWVIDTGRDMSSLLETMARGHFTIHPDYLVVVEREIYVHENQQYLPGVETPNGRLMIIPQLFFSHQRLLQSKRFS